MRSILPLLSLSALLVPVQSLYFYIDDARPKCFFEELPRDTLVVGHYSAEVYNDQRRVWEKPDSLQIQITVDVSNYLPNRFEAALLKQFAHGGSLIHFLNSIIFE